MDGEGGARPDVQVGTGLVIGVPSDPRVGRPRIGPGILVDHTELLVVEEPGLGAEDASGDVHDHGMAGQAVGSRRGGGGEAHVVGEGLDRRWWRRAGRGRPSRGGRRACPRPADVGRRPALPRRRPARARRTPRGGWRIRYPRRTGPGRRSDRERTLRYRPGSPEFSVGARMPRSALTGRIVRRAGIERRPGPGGPLVQDPALARACSANLSSPVMVAGPGDQDLLRSLAGHDGGHRRATGWPRHSTPRHRARGSSRLCRRGCLNPARSVWNDVVVAAEL